MRPTSRSASVAATVSRIAYETPAFREDFRRASRQPQAKIEAFIRKFGEESSRGGMQMKSPERAHDARVKVARVDQGLRAVLLDLGSGDFALLRVMEHDAAYRYAASLRPDVSAFNGLPRLFSVPVVEAEPPMPRAPVPVDVFAHRSDEEMLTVGVPEFGVRMLRSVPDRDAAAELADWLGEADPLVGFAIHHLLDEQRSVDDILRELLALESGPEPDAPRHDGVWNGVVEPEPAARHYDTTDLAAALGRDGAAERFRVVEDSEELVQALQGEFAAWQVFLHPRQRAAAYGDSFSGPARVSGGAGTGKTVVLIHRVKALLDRAPEDQPPRILLTTFTPHLRRDLARLLGQLIGPERAQTVDIRTVDGLARDLHREMTGAEVMELSVEQELELWGRIASSGALGRSATFLRNEYRHVLLARGVRTLDEYLAASRAGRGIRLSADQRRALWPAFEAFEARTRQAGRYSTLQLTESVAALLEQLPAGLFDHVLVDEAQDLHASQWRLLRAVVDEGPDDLFIAGDAFQRIYGDTVSLRSLGIETRGRSLRLRRNYRTTHEIVGWALGVLGSDAVVDIDDLGADLRGYHSVRRGPFPRFEAFPDRESRARRRGRHRRGVGRRRVSRAVDRRRGEDQHGAAGNRQRASAGGRSRCAARPQGTRRRHRQRRNDAPRQGARVPLRGRHRPVASDRPPERGDLPACGGPVPAPHRPADRALARLRRCDPSARRARDHLERRGHLADRTRGR
jgi:hypothetical protein